MAVSSEFEKQPFIRTIRSTTDFAEALRQLDETQDEVLRGSCPMTEATALFYAVQRSSDDEGEAFVRYLCEQRAVCNAVRVDVNKQTPLFFAARDGNAKCARYLLERGCPVDHADKAVQTALFYAAREGRTAVIHVLLDWGASVNAVDHLGQTALFYAARDGRFDAAQLMLQRGADPAVRDKQRKAAASYAQKNGHKDLAALLKPTAGASHHKHGRSSTGPQGAGGDEEQRAPGAADAGGAPSAPPTTTTSAAGTPGKGQSKSKSGKDTAVDVDGDGRQQSVGGKKLAPLALTPIPPGPPPVPRKKFRLEFRAPFTDEEMWLFARDTHVRVFEELFPRVALWRKDIPVANITKVSADAFKSQWYKIATRVVEELVGYEGGWIYSKPAAAAWGGAHRRRKHEIRRWGSGQNRVIDWPIIIYRWRAIIVHL
eukprot:Selendium_serpulae@DN11304_c0_g1_i1.p1